MPGVSQYLIALLTFMAASSQVDHLALAQTTGLVRFHPRGHRYWKCMDVEGGVFANGTPVQIYDCNDSGAQNWRITTGPSGKSHIHTADPKVGGIGGSTAPTYCLDGSFQNPAAGTKLKIWQCQHTGTNEVIANQQWDVDAAIGRINYANSAPGSQKAIAVPNSDVTNGNDLQLQVPTAPGGPHEFIWSWSPIHNW